METALISLVSIALVIISMATMSMGFLRSVSTMSDSWKQMEQEASSIRRTEIAAAPPASYSGGSINITVANQGQTNLGSFSKWDVIAQRQGSSVNYVDYTENNPPGSNQWTVTGIYLSDNITITEVFDPNILNPGETMKVRINLNPEIGAGKTGRITIATPNGITSQSLVTRS